jgi:hypothetical protein
MARRRYQKGSLVPNKGLPANGLWVGRWREDVMQPDGTITRPYKWEILGTIQDYPTRKLALRALEARLSTINSPTYRARPTSTFAEFASRWEATVLSQHKQCGTIELGAEVYASDAQEHTLYHTCKGSACPSCGIRAISHWQRDRCAALPDVPYKGITFTMPDVLWPYFHDRRLARFLPELAAKTLETWVRAKFGVRVGVIAVLHTFNGKLDFNAHVHTMVTAGGLDASGAWVPSLYYDVKVLTEYWRKGVIRLLRACFRNRLIVSGQPSEQIEVILVRQEQRWWSVKVQSFVSRDHFLRYAGRYVRRPPIAQRRIVHVEKEKITFWANDKRTAQRKHHEFTPEEFIRAWMQHIPDRYEHAVRSFGLFAPRSTRKTRSALYASLGRTPARRPRRLSWNLSIKRDFGRDPLVDRNGNRMKWNRRLAPSNRSQA